MLPPVNNKQTQGGLTLVDLLMGIGVVALLMVGLSLFITRGVGANRQQWSHVLATEEARLHAERMTDALRNSRNPTTGELWLVTARDYEVAVFTNGDGASDTEQIRYFIDGTNLLRGVTKEGESEDVTTVARNIRNVEQQIPMLLYFDVGGNQLAPEDARPDTVRSILIRLVVDIDPNALPVREIVETVVLVRGVLVAGTLPAVELLPVQLDFPTGNPPTGLDVKVTIFDSTTGTPLSEEVIPITDINDGRLRVYDGDYYTNINYQTEQIEEYFPGWYAWIGPILVGVSGGQEYTVTEQLTIPELCLGSDLGTLLTSCPSRTVSVGTFSVDYQPIITYTVPGGAEHYVRDITFTFTP